MKSKITILSDSLARCRPLENQFWEDVYPGLLALDNRFFVFDKSKISADSSVFLERENLYFDIKYANSEYFILHLGICDLSPRLFTKKQKLLMKLLEDYPFASRIINRWIAYKSKHRLQLTKEKKKQNVNIDDYEKNIREIAREIRESNPKLRKIFFVNVLHPGLYLIEKNHGILDEIAKYNQKINNICNDHRDICVCIDLYRYTCENKDVVLEDGHHLNNKGHFFIYNEIQKHIES